MRSMRRDSLEHVVNMSVNQTLSRTIITAGTTFLSVLSLYLFGGEVLRGLCVHDARRHRQRHLLDGVHRSVHRHHSEPAEAPVATAALRASGRADATRAQGARRARASERRVGAQAS